VRSRSARPVPGRTVAVGSATSRERRPPGRTAAGSATAREDERERARATARASASQPCSGGAAVARRATQAAATVPAAPARRAPAPLARRGLRPPGRRNRRPGARRAGRATFEREGETAREAARRPGPGQHGADGGTLGAVARNGASVGARSRATGRALHQRTGTERVDDRHRARSARPARRGRHRCAWWRRRRRRARRQRRGTARLPRGRAPRSGDTRSAAGARVRSRLRRAHAATGLSSSARTVPTTEAPRRQAAARRESFAPCPAPGRARRPQLVAAAHRRPASSVGSSKRVWSPEGDRLAEREESAPCRIAQRASAAGQRAHVGARSAGSRAVRS
jgi:hypothetical protein